MQSKIYNQDVIEWANTYKKGKFHALFCDAPYHLTTITKRFSKSKLTDDTLTSKRVRERADGFARLVGTGFMNQDWDGGDIAFQPETWKALGEHLFPGAFGMTFGGSRTAHKIAVAIEDAGFIIHPMIYWIYASGFPKATRIKGHEEFNGHRYGLQALKPAAEPIIVFQKPYESKAVKNIIEYGSGALNIDAGRIPLNGDAYVINRLEDGMKPFGGGAGHTYTSTKVKTELEGELGRWPANFLLDDTVSIALDSQSGFLKSGKMSPKIHKRRKTAGEYQSPHGIYRKFNQDADSLKETIGDSGGASRFFYNVQIKLDEADPFKYCKKASTKERDEGLDELPEQMYAQSGGAQARASQGEDEYLQDSMGLNRITTRRNIHPTIKPIDLTRYLASLLLPPDIYAPRRILIPFSGSGSEMIGSMLAGWEQIVGVEFKQEYCEIAKMRIKHWEEKYDQTS